MVMVATAVTVAVTIAKIVAVPVAVAVTVVITGAVAIPIATAIGALAIVARVVGASGQGCRKDQARQDISCVAHELSPIRTRQLSYVIICLPK